MWFVNIGPVGSGLNAPVYESDGVIKLSGSQYMAELLGGPSASSLGPVATTSFFTGNGAGYFNGLTQGIPGVPGGTEGWVEVLVWNTASGLTFDQAKASGLPNSWWQSSVFTVRTGITVVNPSAGGLLLGLGNSPVFLNGAVPEPSMFALAGLGAALVLFRMIRL